MKLLSIVKRYSIVAFWAACLAVALFVAVLAFPHVNHATTATPKAAVMLAHGPTFPPNPWCDGDLNCTRICNLNCPPNLSGECPSSCQARLLTQFRVATAGHAMPANCKMACCRKKHKNG